MCNLIERQSLKHPKHPKHPPPPNTHLETAPAPEDGAALARRPALAPEAPAEPRGAQHGLEVVAEDALVHLYGFAFVFVVVWSDRVESALISLHPHQNPPAHLLQARQVGGPVRGELPQREQRAVLRGEVLGLDVGVEVLLGPGGGGVAVLYVCLYVLMVGCMC